MNTQTKTILILISALGLIGCGEKEPSKMELLQDASDHNLSQARMFDDGTDCNEIVPNMQTAAANVDYYVHEVKEEQKHSWWWTAGAFVVGLLLGRSEGKREKEKDEESEDVTPAPEEEPEEEPEDDTWKFAPLPSPADNGRYSLAQLETMSFAQLDRVSRTTDTQIPVDLFLNALSRERKRKEAAQ